MNPSARNPQPLDELSGYTHDIMLLIANRKLCRQIVANSPITAIEFFEEMTEQRKYLPSLGQFARNISTEAILNKDSALYHEDNGFDSGLMGFVKPFSQSIYGNYGLVETLSHDSPLDIDYRVTGKWDADQLQAYCNATLITLKSYLLSDKWGQHSYVLTRAMGTIESSCSDIYKISGLASGMSDTDECRRLRVVVGFFRDAMKVLKESGKVPTDIRIKGGPRTLLDLISEKIFDIIFSVSTVKEPNDTAWSVQYGSVWSDLTHTYDKSDHIFRIVNAKLRRLLFDEIKSMNKFANFKNAKILGTCLYILGLETGNSSSKDDYRGFHKLILNWTRNNYLKLREDSPDVANAVLMGTITFDEVNNRLIKTYNKRRERTAPQDFLDLVLPTSS